MILKEDTFIQYNWEDKTVLIVEDDISSIFYLKEILADTSVKIVVVNDGQSALDTCLENNNIDIVLMDIQIPILDGYSTTRKIKEMKPALPVIAQTAYALLEDKHLCFEAGCDGYIAKPIEAGSLLKKMSEFIDK